ncbi:heparinase II/III family protein [Granulosicoccus antarcticus]|uniref:heparinase II/III family protein n=1 Tax=Granulosicoccus antarcticus TaxID=437505 RepID=UPI0012FD0230|nr:alginate lyase family protein [Granulosicoccus antarcticus]
MSGAQVRTHTRPMTRFVPAKQSIFVPDSGLETARSESTSRALLADCVFKFLGDEHQIQQPKDWNCETKEKLFLYNVHYFDDLNAVGWAQRSSHHTALIENWIADNPGSGPERGGNGWEPYPLSLRIINWIQFFERLETVPEHWLNSLATQAQYLFKRLEYHLLGNHLFTNAKALVYAGCYLEHHEACLNKGLSILQKEIPEQILADGGHFELSPMYHSIALADLLDLINLARSYPQQIPDAFTNTLTKVAQDMFAWLLNMQHPDGQISLFNDAAMDIAPDYQELAAYAKSLDLALPLTAGTAHYAKHSGYVTLHSQELCCIMDVGNIGPDYIPGHAHADSLTFELSLFGQRLLCNSGTSVYGTGPERLRQRGTASHNTVVVNNRNSSEVWSGFRVARRAKPFDVKVDISTIGYNATQVFAAHSGYRRLAGKNIHSRQWSFGPGSLTITDKLTGPFDSAVAYFHLHPDIHVDISPTGIELRMKSGQTVQLRTSGGIMQVEPSTWHPCFGASIPSNRIAITFKKAQIVTQIAWKNAPLNP